ncbi:hypothetical protein ABZ543_08225 [Streptomyces roseifaciens]
MSTKIFDRIVSRGTGRNRTMIRLGDGTRIAIRTQANPRHGIDEIHVELGEAPRGRGWMNRDTCHGWKTPGGYFTGDLYLEVPASDVRAFIRQNGGEHRDQSGC